MVRSYLKRSSTKLSEHFTSDEFDCHCSSETCTFTLIDDLLVDRLEKIRVATQRKIRIHSGFRCPVRQDTIRGLGFQTVQAGKLSTHENGMAADFDIEGMTGHEAEQAAREAGFTSVGVAHSWIHADTRQGNHRWTYPPQIVK